MSVRRGGLIVSLIAAFALLLPAAAQAVDRFDVLEVRTRGYLQPVPTSDQRKHLVYELRITNLSAQFPVVIERVELRGGGRTLASLDQEALGPDMDLGDPFKLVQTTELEPAQTATVWMHPDFPRGRKLPKFVRHVIHVKPRDDVDPAQFDLRYGRRVVTGRSRLELRPPLRLRSPLRGQRYLALSGCCESRHARSALALDGIQWVSERFAVDWIQLNAQGEVYRGDGSRLTDHFIYGDPIRAAGPGKVVRAVDRFPNTPPFERDDSTVTPKRAAGNHVIIKHGPRHFALYAHMKPGSVRVKRGQRVRAGQIIGRVGSSGNSDAPHLHFHVADRPSPLGADGRPYVYSRYWLQGRVRGEDEIVWFDRKRPRRNSLPMGDTIIVAR